MQNNTHKIHKQQQQQIHKKQTQKHTETYTHTNTQTNTQKTTQKQHKQILFGVHAQVSFPCLCSLLCSFVLFPKQRLH